MMHPTVLTPLALVLSASALAQSAAAEREALELAFAQQMTGCQMVGHFTRNGSDKAPREESYTIAKVEKVSGDQWKFAAKIEYEGKSVTVPLIVDVIWAGDTPTIQVTKMAVPTLGTYSARVAIYDDQYAGLWSGANNGGHMYGKIVRAAGGHGSGNWATWRGPKGSGEAPGGNPPTKWSENENIRWKVELPGLGNSTPVVWRDRIYVTTAIETDEDGKAPALPAGTTEERAGRQGGERGGRGRGHSQEPPLTKVFDFRVIALDRKDGSVIWSKSVNKAVPHERGHATGSQASASPMTDGEFIYAHFGSRGIHCLDMDGGVKWSKDFGQMRTRNQFGEGSSPAISGNTLIVNWDHEGDSFVCALDKRTGNEIWRVPRDEITSWSTPVIAEVDGRAQAIITGTGASRAYDVETGAVIWSCKGMTTNAIPTPIVRDGTVWLMSGFRGAMLQAIKLSGAKGDITDSEHVLWTHDRQTSYVPSALLYGDRIWFLRSNNAVLTCLDAITGKLIYEGERLPGLRTVYASPVGASGHVFLTSREGATKVIKASDTLEEVSINELEDTFDASLVILGNEIYLRGHRFLYCVAETPAKK